MNDATAEALRQLFGARSSADAAMILAGLPYVDGDELAEACRRPDAYGFAGRERAFLMSIAGDVTLLLRALAEQLAPDIPATIYGQLGRAFRVRGQLERAERLYKCAFHNARDARDKAAGLCGLGLVAFDGNHLPEAEKMLLRARRTAEGVGGVAVVDIVNALGAVVDKARGPAAALPLFEEAASLARASRLGAEFVMAQINAASAALKANEVARGAAALDAMGDMVKGRGGPEEEAYHALRRDLAAAARAAGGTAGPGASGAGSPQPVDVVVSLARAVAVGAASPGELRQRLLEWPGALEDVARAIFEAVAAMGPPRAPPVSIVRLFMAGAVRDVARERRAATASMLAALEVVDLAEVVPPGDRITWFDEALGLAVTAGVTLAAPEILCRAQLHRALGDAHDARAAPGDAADREAAVHHWEEALRYFAALEARLADGAVHAPPSNEASDRAAFGSAAAALHYRIGTQLNALARLGRRDGAEAVRHFEAALGRLPDGPESARLRDAILMNLSNAVGTGAGSPRALVTKGQRDQEAVARSLELQADALKGLRDPAERFAAFMNLAATYQEKAEGNPADAARYLDAAAACLEDGREALATRDALLALDRRMDGDPLEAIAARLRAALPLGPQIVHPELGISLFTTAATVEERLGRRACAYRRLLSGLRVTYARLDAGGPDAARRADALIALYGRLVKKLIAWNQPARALYFHAAERAREWPRVVTGADRVVPRRPPGPAAADRAAVTFQIDFKRAFALVRAGGRSAVWPYEFPPMRLLQTVGRWLEAMLGQTARTGGDGAGDGADDPGAAERAERWQADIDGFSAALGRGLFEPLAPWLPDHGELVIVPDPSMALAPLHLARLGPSRLMDRFAVRYCEYIDFWSGAPPAAAVAPAPAPARGPVFVAAYSPPEEEGGHLPFAAVEAAAVAAARRGDAELVVGAEATPDAVLDGIAKRQVVHLCCHGSWVWDDPLASSLTLAGRPLTLREIALRLQRSPCELIVLSACEVGRRSSGQARFEGFGPFLLRAGCKAFLGALWPVGDLATTLLLGRFYEEWSGAAAEAAEALRRAQLWLAAESGARLGGRLRALRAATRDVTTKDAAYIDARLAQLDAAGEGTPFAASRSWGAFQVTEAGAPPP
jgi:hypothetical protein